MAELQTPPIGSERAPLTRTGGWVLAVIIIVGAALRIHFADSALWYDEIVTLTDSVRSPFPELLSRFPSNNNHVLYSLLARVSVLQFGEHAWSLRLPAVAFGILCLPMLYILGAYVTSRFEALAATALLAVSYHHVWFSQNARGYTILLFGALLATYLLLLGLRENRRAAYVAYAVTTALTAYTHLTMVVAVLGQAAVVFWHALSQVRSRPLRSSLALPVAGFFLAGLLTILLYAPMLGDLKAFFGATSSGAKVATPEWALLEVMRGLKLGYSTAAALVVGAALMIVGCWSYWRQSPTVIALFIAPGAALFLVAVLLQRPTFPRFFFFLIGFAMLIAVRGVMEMAGWLSRRFLPRAHMKSVSRWIACLLLATMGAVSIVALPAAYRYPKQDYARAIRYVEAHIGDGDAVALAGGGVTAPYRDYFGKSWRRLSTPVELSMLLQQHDTVWMLYTFRRYIEALEPALMQEIAARCTQVEVIPATVADGAIVVSKCH